ncbi:MAG: hypothetical protein GYB68_06520 [Chloroflexi bacterium]|nr:hypothetical protein [Chloroflexota bacterium]
MIERRPFFKFTPEDDQVWKLLYQRQWEHAHKYGCQMFIEGVEIMQLGPKRIPDFEALNKVYQERVDWELLSTDIVYADGQTWFEHLKERQFLISEYIRDASDLDYTPLPDIWHDAFGHLPFVTNQRYADLIREYAIIQLEAAPEVRKPMGSIWWYTIEFGLIREQGELKAFGTGLLSSYGELLNVFDGNVELRPFDPDDMGRYEPSPHAMHEVLWILDSFEQLEEFVYDYRKQMVS